MAEEAVQLHGCVGMTGTPGSSVSQTAREWSDCPGRSRESPRGNRAGGPPPGLTGVDASWLLRAKEWSRSPCRTTRRVITIVDTNN
nr:hypothetical protein [Rhodococcus wratislaviensis]